MEKKHKSSIIGICTAQFNREIASHKSISNKGKWPIALRLYACPQMVLDGANVSFYLNRQQCNDLIKELQQAEEECVEFANRQQFLDEMKCAAQDIVDSIEAYQSHDISDDDLYREVDDEINNLREQIDRW